MHYTPRMQATVGWFGVGFTAVDALMTAGYMLLTIPVWFMAPVYALFAGMGAVVLAYMLSIGAVAWARHFKVVAVIVWAAFIPAFALNFTWNFGITATMLETNIKEGRVREVTTKDVRGEIERLQKRHDDLTRQIEFAAHLSSPEAYDAQIESAELARDNEAKRGGCGRVCEKKTEELAILRANKANAERARQAREDRRTVAAALAAAKAEYQGVDKTVSEAEAQARLISRLLTRQVKPDEVTVDWTSIYLSLGASLFVSVMASLCNLVRALNLAGTPNEHDSWAHRQAITAAPAYQPVPLQSEPAATPVKSSSSHSETVTYSYNGHHAPSAIGILQAVRQHHLDEAARIRARLEQPAET